MVLYQSPFPDLLGPMLEFLSNILRGFNVFCYYFFQYGNVVFFFIFLIMGITLLANAKDKEYHEKIYARNLEFIKRRGRIGTAICLILSIAFLSKGFPVFLLWCFESFSHPLICLFPGVKEYYDSGTTLNAVYSFDLGYTSIYFLFSLISMISIITVAFGIYLALFNKRVLRSKFKPYKILVAGIIQGIMFGFPTCLRLIV